jgi:hypothetical protein
MTYNAYNLTMLNDKNMRDMFEPKYTRKKASFELSSQIEN